MKAASSGRTADLSRRHKVLTSASGVSSVTGGKLTTYREMAEDTVDAVVVEQLDGLPPIGPAMPHPAARAARRRSGGPPARPRHLADRYGSEATRGRRR